MNLKLGEAEVSARNYCFHASRPCTDVGINSKPVALNLPRQDDKLHQNDQHHLDD